MTIDVFTINDVKPGTHWQGISAAGYALKLANASQKIDKPFILLTPDTATAIRLENNLRFFGQTKVWQLPDWETLAYDHFSPHNEIISQRLHTLHQLPLLTQGIVIVPVATLMQRIAPPAYINSHYFCLRIGDIFGVSQRRQNFIHYGYRLVEQVLAHGEFAIRGGIIDVYPMGSDYPLRIELFDNEIESLRCFDPDSQRSLAKLEQFTVLPAHEFPLDDAAIVLFRQQWRSQFAGNPANCPIYRDVSEGLSPAGIEYYLPLFFEQTASLFDYFPNNALIVTQTANLPAMQQHWQAINARYQQYCHDVQRPLLAPDKLFLSADETEQKIVDLQAINLDIQADKLPDVSIDNHQRLGKLQDFLRTSNTRVLLCAESAGRLDALQHLLQKNQLQANYQPSWQDFLHADDQLAITIARIDVGLPIQSANITVIAESQLFDEQVMQRRRRKTTHTDNQTIINNLAELAVGMPVVHIDHGVGRYLGLETLSSGEQIAEYLTIEYADNNKLYVPVTNLQLISRYGGIDNDNVNLHHLSGQQWQKAREKAAKRAYDVAAELLEVHAQRASRCGVQFDLPKLAYQQFAQSFGFEETPDQQQTITQVINDMTSDKPMDRLVCGDVGFGKTEVAMRAAFIAVHNNKQVAVLVPTTLLAQQHYTNFCDRFADSAINIALLSRFRSRSEQSQTLTGMANGNVDIVIGTHKLLQKDIDFARLGLLIIDEEHRFGVRQKETLKALRAEVDMLTLTATPIPRTLNMALSDVRDLSIIATPPAKRLAIKTFTHRFEWPLIREAIMRELARGGQVYYLHNRVDTIMARARDLQELLPEATVVVGHGQMPEKQLEKVMTDFYHQRFTILLCTTIIETGIDVPTANTIIIERADKFGLAQLHQLRGRVGRSHHQAYAYLLTPEQSVLTSDAKKRLEAISQLEDLGVGFTLATHDLEIRGAGEFLGDEQSGHIQNVGFSLYMTFLERAVESIKSGKQVDFSKPSTPPIDIDLGISTIIPDDYVPDIHTRLVLYKRLSSAKDAEQLQELQVEMIDRFGILPLACQHLFAVTAIKQQAELIGIEKIRISGDWLRIEFQAQANIDPLRIIQLVQKNSQQYQLQAANILRMQLSDNDERLQAVEQLLQYLSGTN